MDGMEDCPWGLLSLAGVLAVLVVAPSQCVEAAAGAADDGDGGRRRGNQGGGCCTLQGIVAGCRWTEAILALTAVSLGVVGVVWTATHGGGHGCQWLHLVSRLVASTLLLAPAVATLVHRQTAPVKSTWGPYVLNGMAMLLVAGAGRLYGENGEAAGWGDRNPGLLLEAGVLGVLALLVVVKAVATVAARAAVVETTKGGPAVAGNGRQSSRPSRRHRHPDVEESLEAPLLGEHHGAADTQSGSKEAFAAPATLAPLDRAGLWSRLIFRWVGPLLRTGAARQLGPDDVPPLAAEDGTARWSRRFDTALEAERARAKPSLLRAARVVFGADFYAFAGLQLINDLLGFSGPVLLKLVVTYVQDFAGGTATLARGYAILLVLLLTYTITAVLSTQYALRMARLQLRVRAALVAAVYAQVLRCRAPQLGCLGSGEMTNLISLDVQRLQDAASSFNSFWSLPVQVVLTLYLLYREVSYAFVAGLAILAFMVPLNMAISSAITRITLRQMGFKDQRVQSCDEMLHSIRTLKMLAWEDHLAAALQRLRQEEMVCLARRKVLDALCVIFWASTPVLTAFATFAAVVYIEHAIDPAAVFTTIALLQMLTFPLNAFPWILNGLMEARVSKRRLQRFLFDTPAPPNYVIQADDGSTHDPRPGPDSLTKKPRRTPTIEGIFRNTAAAAGASSGAAKTGGAGPSYCLEVFGSFAWEQPPLPPPSLPPTLEGHGEEDEDGAVLGLLATPMLPERVVELEELQEAEGLIPSANAASEGDGDGSGGSTVDAGMDEETKGQDNLSGEEQQPQHKPRLRGFVVHELGLRVRKGEIVGVYGRIGAGKSSLLAAILGELYAVPSAPSSTTLSPSRVVLRARRVAYVAQSPWLQRGSVRDNIVFGSPWDAARFEAVVAACGLDQDFAALPGGAETEVGESGLTLSGGQRQRVALARALYSRAEVYLLDDPFSGLDGRTMAHVAREAVQGIMRREGGTVVLVTHALPLLAACDWAVAMRGGRVVERIRVRQQKLAAVAVAAAIAAAPSALSPAVVQESGSPATEVVAAPASTPASGESEEVEIERKGEAAALATDETREEGKVRWCVYRYYVMSAGRILSFCTVASLLAMQLSSNAMNLWLSVWSAHVDRYTPPQFLAVSGAIAGANAGFTILRSFLFAWGGLRAARRLHDRMLASVLHAAIAFFEANPVGRILNRFSGDTWTVDDSLPFILNILLAQSAALVGTAVVLVLVSPWTLLVLLLVTPLYHRLQAFYRASSRELKRLDSVTRSPLLGHFSETMAGAVTVRAFGASPRFRAQSLALMDANQRVAFYSSAVSQWLGLRIQVIGVVVVASVAAWAVGSCAAHQPAPAELIGLALSYASGVLGNLGGLLNSYAETEREMVAVERVQEFTAQPPESEVAAPPAVEVAVDWPWAGEVRVEDLCLRYRPGWPRALDRVSLRVPAGAKLAVCGRTGSGKSSLLACLFRLVAWEEGSIVVDGAPLDRVPLQQLRSALAIIPQEPVLFRGTVRSNLDPAGEYDDAALSSALQACSMDAVLREHHAHQHRPTTAGAGAGATKASTPSITECLEMEVQEKGGNFSVGQRQLLCLCRVLLRRARLVCVDEATASLDAATDAQVRRTIASAFRDATVVMIAHRISTVLELCTRAVVLSEGRVVEEGDPRQLLLNPRSNLYALSKAEENGSREDTTPKVQ